MREIHQTFDNGRGQRLSARLVLPAGTPRAWALFAHCFTCSKNLRAAYHIGEALAEAGFATLRFDFTGLGESEGDFAETHFSSNVEDLVAAAHHLESTSGHGPGLLVGHSFGGAAVLQAASRIDSCQAVAPSAPPLIRSTSVACSPHRGKPSSATARPRSRLPAAPSPSDGSSSRTWKQHVCVRPSAR